MRNSELGEVFIGIGLPGTHASFLTAVEQGHDLCAKLATKYGGHAELAWELTYRSIADSLHEFTAWVRAAGGRVAEEMTADQLLHALAKPPCATLVTIAHTSSEDLWVLDRGISFHQISTSVSPDFEGMIDLIGCFSLSLADQIKRHSPQVTLAGSPNVTDLTFRLQLLRSTLDMMRRFETSYIDSVHEIRMALKARLAAKQNSHG